MAQNCYESVLDPLRPDHAEVQRVGRIGGHERDLQRDATATNPVSQNFPAFCTTLYESDSNGVPKTWFKEGLGTVKGVTYSATRFDAPNKGNAAAADDTTPTHEVIHVHDHPKTKSDQQMLEVAAKIQIANYLFVQRYLFMADGTIHFSVALGGRLLPNSAIGSPIDSPQSEETAHVHNFYFRIVPNSKIFPEVFELDTGDPSAMAEQKWAYVSRLRPRPLDVPAMSTNSHLKNRRWGLGTWKSQGGISTAPADTPDKANTFVKGYTLSLPRLAPPDGVVSVADVFVVPFPAEKTKAGIDFTLDATQLGAEIGTPKQFKTASGGTVLLPTDEDLITMYGKNATSKLGPVTWCVLRGYHDPRVRRTTEELSLAGNVFIKGNAIGEDLKTVIWHEMEGTLEPNFLHETTPLALYDTNPSSP